MRAVRVDASAGNDFWVMDYDPAAGTWQHLGAIPGHPIAADVDCYGGPRSAKFAVVGDFDGDGRDEIAVCASGSGNASAGNDFWVMDFDPTAGTWQHLGAIPGHPIAADVDCYGGPRSAQFAVVGDFDGDGRDEIAVCASGEGNASAGNDFWVMDYDPVAGTWQHLSQDLGHPIEADFDCFSGPRSAAFAVVAGDFDRDGRDEVAVCASANEDDSAGNDFWVMDYDPAARRWRHLSPITHHPIGADVDCYGGPRRARFAVAGDFDGDGRHEIARVRERRGQRQRGKRFLGDGVRRGHAAVGDADPEGGRRHRRALPPGLGLVAGEQGAGHHRHRDRPGAVLRADRRRPRRRRRSRRRPDGQVPADGAGRDHDEQPRSASRLLTGAGVGNPGDQVSVCCLTFASRFSRTRAAVSV